MSDAIYVLLGVVFGVLAGWYLASRHSHRLAKLAEDEKRQAARAVRSATEQLAAQLEQKDQELSHFQARLDEQRQTAESTLSRLQADLAHATTQKATLEKVAAELEAAVGALKAELQSTTEEAFRELEQFHDVNLSLERTLEAFSQLVGTVESRLLSVNLRLKKLGVATDRSLPAEPSAQPAAARREGPAAPTRANS